MGCSYRSYYLFHTDTNFKVQTIFASCILNKLSVSSLSSLDPHVISSVGFQEAMCKSLKRALYRCAKRCCRKTGKLQYNEEPVLASTEFSFCKVYIYICIQYSNNLLLMISRFGAMLFLNLHEHAYSSRLLFPSLQPNWSWKAMEQGAAKSSRIMEPRHYARAVQTTNWNSTWLVKWNCTKH